MRLYLSSFGLGNHPEALVALLAGRRRAAVVLNAKDGSTDASRSRSLAEEMAAMAHLGLDPIELDLRDSFGQPGRLREALAAIDLLWVRGGNTFVLRRAFRQSGLDGILPDLLQRDAIVYGGFSAAVAVLTPSLRGIELVDDPEGVPEGYDPAPIWDGLGLLPYTVAPHYRSDHPESERVEELVRHYIDRHLLFRALRDGEAIVVDGAGETVHALA
ncbi:MAG: Type 1 glutamine amidotransferase-like domain-containing protein [Fimbriimonas sp.]